MLPNRTLLVFVVIGVLFFFPVVVGGSANSSGESFGDSTQDQLVGQSTVVTESIANYSLKQLDSSTEHSIERVTVDVGAAVTMEYNKGQTEFAVYSLEHEIASGDSTSDYSSLLETATSVEEEAIALELREAEVREAYLAGRMTPRQYLRELSLIAMKANLLEEYISDIEPYVDDTPNGGSIDARLSNANGVVLGLHGSVRDRVRHQQAGILPSGQVFVSAAPNGVLLASVHEDQYEREFYRASDRSNGPSADVGLIGAVSQFQDEYPEVADAESGMDIGSVGAPDRDVFTFRVQLPEGVMVLYYEQSTEEFYYESSTWDLDRIELPAGSVVTERNTRVMVNESFVGGPVQIATFNNETNEAVSSTVLIGQSQEVQTGSDGQAWGIVPVGEYSITVVRDTGNITIPMSGSGSSGI